MKNSKLLAKSFTEVMLNGRWIANTNFKDQLSQVTWEEATTQIGSLNTLAALAYHINYYIAGMIHVFEGGPLEIRDKYSFDLQGLDSAEDWDNFRQTMWANAEKFAAHVEAMSDEQLGEPFVDEKYGTYQRNIEGATEHGYYHLGQVSLIRKMIREQSN